MLTLRISRICGSALPVIVFPLYLPGVYITHSCGVNETRSITLPALFVLSNGEKPKAARVGTRERH